MSERLEEPVEREIEEAAAQIMDGTTIDFAGVLRAQRLAGRAEERVSWLEAGHDADEGCTDADLSREEIASLRAQVETLTRTCSALEHERDEERENARAARRERDETMRVVNSQSETIAVQAARERAALAAVERLRAMVACTDNFDHKWLAERARAEKAEAAIAAMRDEGCAIMDHHHAMEMLSKVVEIEMRANRAEADLATANERLSLPAGDLRGHMLRCARVSGEWVCHEGCPATGLARLTAAIERVRASWPHIAIPTSPSSQFNKMGVDPGSPACLRCTIEDLLRTELEATKEKL